MHRVEGTAVFWYGGEIVTQVLWYENDQLWDQLRRAADGLRMLDRDKLPYLQHAKVKLYSLSGHVYDSMSAFAATPSKKTRLSFDVSPEVKKQLEDLQEKSQATSMLEVVRRALSLYEMVLDVQTAKGQVQLVDASGERTKVHLL
jgi:hypothetical protein